MKKIALYIENPIEIVLVKNSIGFHITIPSLNIYEKFINVFRRKFSVEMYFSSFKLSVFFEDKKYTITDRITGENIYSSYTLLTLEKYALMIDELIEQKKNIFLPYEKTVKERSVEYSYFVEQDYCDKLFDLLNFRVNFNEFTDFQKCRIIMDWISNNIRHDGSLQMEERVSMFYKLSEIRTFNCRGIAKLANELLLGVGIKNRIVFCLPYRYDDYNSHVLITAYIKELKKWILLDPTYNTFIYNTNILSIHEFRESLIFKCNETSLYLSKKSSHNGMTLCKGVYLREMRRSFYKFLTPIHNFPGCDFFQNYIGLAPIMVQDESCIYIDNPDVYWS